jgi:hypothetical protein
MITLKGWAGAFTAACLGITMAHVAPLLATEREEPRPQILFTNVHIFDGKSEELAEGHCQSKILNTWSGHRTAQIDPEKCRKINGRAIRF